MMAALITLVFVLLGLIGAFVCGFFLLFYIYPHHIVSYGFMFRRYLAGMKIKFVKHSGGTLCYAEKNVPQPDKLSIVFVHGFSSSKDQWIPCFKGLPKDLHMLALDLPGHGASSTPDEDIELGLEYVVETLNTFLKLVGLENKQIHLVGSSLGGAIAGLYTAHHPEKVAKLTLVCPAMETPVESNFALQLKQAMALGPENITIDHCALLASDVKGMKNLFSLCCYNKNITRVNDQICKGFLTLRMPKLPFFLRLFKSVISEEHLNLLLNAAPNITPPTQVIWGANDQLINVSGAELLRSQLPNCRHVDIIDNCGHAIDMDRPGAFNKHLLKFVLEDCSDKKTD
ncbi:monoacylglycerol lipase ABHD6-like [Physella acuta]|uniref:monoacylglycerol lipase ABHD6-like n=1 Tax=Physella acuta TaxID=109671 RepID=UPI0027DCC0C7|nr:monoacylglycerol lipase ABHD6-like [Physella acuta]XP_059147199.1 monoacylglycerol lipase ABHD6-like [Physella acuta]XP_059147200.1 monoacylglycerol lipase ABHD6-like [Physella acuta]